MKPSPRGRRGRSFTEVQKLRSLRAQVEGNLRLTDIFRASFATTLAPLPSPSQETGFFLPGGRFDTVHQCGRLSKLSLFPPIQIMDARENRLPLPAWTLPARRRLRIDSRTNPLRELRISAHACVVELRVG